MVQAFYRVVGGEDVGKPIVDTAYKNIGHQSGYDGGIDLQPGEIEPVLRHLGAADFSKRFDVRKYKGDILKREGGNTPQAIYPGHVPVVA